MRIIYDIPRFLDCFTYSCKHWRFVSKKKEQKTIRNSNDETPKLWTKFNGWRKKTQPKEQMHAGAKEINLLFGKSFYAEGNLWIKVVCKRCAFKVIKCHNIRTQ